jgi:hypothetical protein
VLVLVLVLVLVPTLMLAPMLVLKERKRVQRWLRRLLKQVLALKELQVTKSRRMKMMKPPERMHEMWIEHALEQDPALL